MRFIDWLEMIRYWNTTSFLYRKEILEAGMPSLKQEPKVTRHAIFNRLKTILEDGFFLFLHLQPLPSWMMCVRSRPLITICFSNSQGCIVTVAYSRSAKVLLPVSCSSRPPQPTPPHRANRRERIPTSCSKLDTINTYTYMCNQYLHICNTYLNQYYILSNSHTFIRRIYILRWVIVRVCARFLKLFPFFVLC